jgi:hypothetical protein
MKYTVRASDYLARAQQERRAKNPARLFYSALELRCGVEARLHEYRDAIRKKKRDNVWRVRFLKREVESLVDKFEKPVTIRLQIPETGEHLPMRYVPVSDELKSIAQRLGDYLHCVGVEKVQQKGFWTQFSSMVDRGITLLSDAASGDLLAPPMWQNKGKRVIFAFDQGNMPSFFTEGAQVEFNVTLRVHSKTRKMFILKNAPGPPY